MPRSNQIFLTCLVTIAGVLAGCASSSTVTTAPIEEGAAGRFAAEIERFEQWDSKNAIPDRPVLFVGSSSIRMWPTAEHFDGLPVINRGFGGSQFSDLNNYFDTIVAPYEPEVIVVYEGDNDINAGKSSQDVLDGFMRFVEQVHNVKPESRIIFISIKPSPARWERLPTMSEANTWIRDVTTRDSRLYYADLATPLLTEEGTPDVSLFLDDGVHLNAEGYEIWSRRLAPILLNARRLPLP